MGKSGFEVAPYERPPFPSKVMISINSTPTPQGSLCGKTSSLDSFARHLQLRKSPHTVRAYTSDLRQFLDWCSAQGIEQAASRDIGHFLLSLSHLNRSSLARKLAALSTYYTYLKGEGLVSANPVLEVERFKLEKRLPDYLTLEQVRRIRQACPPNISPLFEFLLSSGVRESEACALNWEKVDLENRMARVLGKGGKEREVLFSPLAARLLQLGDGPVFAARGRRLNSSQIYYRIHKLGNLIGRDIYPHLLRHTLATHLLASGMSLAEVSALLGHEDIRTTAIYTHPTGRLRQGYEQAIAEFG